MKNPSLRPYLVLAIGLLAVSSASVFIRLAQDEKAGSLVIAMWRVTMATLILTPLVLTRYRAELAQLKRAEIGLALVSGVFLAIHFASWITSLEYTSILTSTSLVSTHPLIVAILTPILLREKINTRTLQAIGLALVGTFIISALGNPGTAPRQDSPLLGAVLAVVGAVAVAGYYLVGRKLRGSVSVIVYIWLTYGAAALVLIPLVLLSGQQITGLTANAYLWMTLTALLPQLIGHSSFNYALGYLSAAFVSLTLLGEPVFSTLFAIPSLKELPAPPQLIGSALILVALVFASRAESSAKQAAAPIEAADVGADFGAPL